LLGNREYSLAAFFRPEQANKKKRKNKNKNKNK